MSVVNGNGRVPIKIGCRGKKLFEFDGQEPFECDVILAANEWEDVQRDFVELTDEIDPETHERRRRITNLAGWMGALVAFVQGKCGHEVDGAQARAFLARLQEEAAELQDFFVPRSPAKSSSPGRPGSTAMGSTPGPNLYSSPVSSEQPPGSYSTITEVMSADG